MNIYIPPGKQKEFLDLSQEYSDLHKELKLSPSDTRRSEIIERIIFISRQFETGFKEN